MNLSQFNSEDSVVVKAPFTLQPLLSKMETGIHLYPGFLLDAIVVLQPHATIFTRKKPL